nr:MAG TPA: hypothetical protein [Caudoviricetes sp.]
MERIGSTPINVQKSIKLQNREDSHRRSGIFLQSMLFLFGRKIAFWFFLIT